MILLFLLFSLTLKGRVLDEEKRKPVPYASVEILELKYGTYADEEGRFSLEVDEEELTP